MSRFRTVERVVAEEMAKPYQYGVADCFFFGCRMVDALDDRQSLAATYAGSYKSLIGAQKALRKRGHKRLADLFGKHLAPTAPAMAQLGDIVIISMGGGDHVGVCVGAQFVTKTESGPSFHGLPECTAAFRVG